MDSMDWEILVELFNQKNITKTSDSLRISQPAVTYRINNLEKEFNVKLIYREKKGIIFTSQGEMLVDYSTEMLSNAQKIKEKLLNQSNEVQGVLRLSASSIFSRYQLPTILSEFNKKYPSVEFDVITGWSEDVLKSVHNDNSQVGIIRGDYNFPSIKKVLRQEKLYIVSNEPISMEKLPKIPRIYYNTDTSLKKLIDSWWIGKFLEPSLITMKVDNMETCKELVLNGLGFAILPSILLSEEEKLYKTPCLNKNGDYVTRSTYLILKEQYLHNNVVKAFYNFIKEMEL